ncbi:unnamed protein product [Allacma fusca]|uniref:Uncharacterized protein n=1 Tax=Allacma fusca TaxID=39272 RepID=A0A8J2LU34_9HEXA|nr:unnamed protein product [Allacma fusca]
MMKNRRVVELHKIVAREIESGDRCKEHRRTLSLTRRKSCEPESNAKLSLGCTTSPEEKNSGGGGSEVRILINDETEPRKDIDQMPRRPLKRKSQDLDRNFLSETGSLGTPTASEFWLPKVKVTPSMVTRLNAEILANFHEALSSSHNEDEQRLLKITKLLQEFFSCNGFFGSSERITDAVETLSTRIVAPSDDELWTILTTEKVINVKFAFVLPQSPDLERSMTSVKILGSFPLLQIRRILTDRDLSLAYLVGPDIEIVTGDSAKTEKLISSILVATLRVQKTNSSISSDTSANDSTGMEVEPHSGIKSPSKVSHHKPQRLQNPPEFLEVANVLALEIPSIRAAFKRLFPFEKEIFHSSAVVVRFEEMASDIEVPIKIQVAQEGDDFRASILKLSGCMLSFCNPIRSFFTFNPGNNLTNIDVSNTDKFSVKRIESPKPHSLLMIYSENYYILETSGAQVAEDIFQRIQAIQRNSVCGKGKQVAHIFITGQSLIAFQIHSYESIFQVPVINVVKLHSSSNQTNTCVLELDSTEAMDFISTDSPCWSLTFASSSAKEKFLSSLLSVTPSLATSLQHSQQDIYFPFSAGSVNMFLLSGRLVSDAKNLGQNAAYI